MDDSHLNDNGISRQEKVPFSLTEALPLLVVAGLLILFLACPD